MSKKIVNLKHIVSITIKDKRPCKHFEYQRLRESNTLLGKILGGDRKEGFYTTQSYSIDFFLKEQLENGEYCDTPLLVIETDVFYYPEVIIKFVNNDKHCRTFETMEEAEEFAKEIAKSIPHRIQYEIED